MHTVRALSSISFRQIKRQRRHWNLDNSKLSPCQHIGHKNGGCVWLHLAWAMCVCGELLWGFSCLATTQPKERWIHQHSCERRHCEIRKGLLYLFVWRSRNCLGEGVWEKREPLVFDGEALVSFDWISVVLIEVSVYIRCT